MIQKTVLMFVSDDRNIITMLNYCIIIIIYSKCSLICLHTQISKSVKFCYLAAVALTNLIFIYAMLVATISLTWIEGVEKKMTKQDLYLCIHCIGFYEVVKNLIHISLYKIDSHECADKVRYIFLLQHIIYVAETVCVQCIFEKCLRLRHRVHSICKEKVHTVL